MVSVREKGEAGEVGRGGRPGMDSREETEAGIVREERISDRLCTFPPETKHRKNSTAIAFTLVVRVHQHRSDAFCHACVCGAGDVEPF